MLNMMTSLPVTGFTWKSPTENWPDVIARLNQTLCAWLTGCAGAIALQ